MPLIKGDRAPYAPPSTVLEVIDRYRNFSMATPVDLDVIQLAGVAESLAPRTLQALRLLDLIDDQGNPEQVFNELRETANADLPGRLAEHLRQVYQEVFAFVDPKADPIDRVEDAFRSFHPHGQRARMVTLFMGLCERAGLADEAVAPRAPSKVAPKPVAPRSSRPPAEITQDEPIPPALTGLLHQLPAAGSAWSRDRRDSFMRLFGAVLDFVYEIEDDKLLVGPPAGEADAAHL
ncbi:MAG: DUF5343 domain-containing protein [Acidimicrobiia bacterium]